MPQLSLDIAEKLIDACKAGAGDAGARLSAALDNTIQITDVVGTDPLAGDQLPEELSAPGLAMAFHIGGQAIALLLPEATNLLPPWYAAPDTDGEAKLQTLAKELATLLLPEDLAADKFTVGPVGDLTAAIGAAKLADPAGSVQLTMTGEGGDGTCHLLWPLAAADALLSKVNTSSSASVAKPPAASGQLAQSKSDALPKYSRSLLSVRVPVIVNLAETKMNVNEVIHLGPGAIIQFDKSCEAMLDLEAGGHKIATGEAVKVGDKFGLRITSMRLPEERYQPIGTRD